MEFHKSVMQIDEDSEMQKIECIVDEDGIVPDAKPDIDRMISDSCEMEAVITKRGNTKAVLEGNLKYRFLYGNAKLPGMLYQIEGSIPVNEAVHLESKKEDETDAMAEVQKEADEITYQLDDFQITMINSRKYNVKGVITARSRFGAARNVEITSDVDAGEQVRKLQKTVPALELACCKKDLYRVREEITIPKNKPNMDEILWSFVNINGITFQTKENVLEIGGQLDFFVLYRPSDEDAPLQWLEHSFPFTGTIDAQNIHADMIHNIHASLGKWEIQIKNDEDGESRILGVDACVMLNIKVYQEVDVPVLWDLYSTKEKMTLQKHDQPLEKFVMKNVSKVKLKSRIKADEKNGSVLSVCTPFCEVIVDDSHMEQDGIEVDGILRVKLLYISSDDQFPVCQIVEEIPFSQKMDAEFIDKENQYDLCAALDSVQAGMSGANEMEVKAEISLQAFVTRQVQIPVIQDIASDTLTKKDCETFPCITGYIVKDTDTLWEIAKKNYTTEEDIRKLNHLEEAEVKPGDKLILVRPEFTTV